MRDSCNIRCHKVAVLSEVLVSRGILGREKKASGNNKQNLAREALYEKCLQGRNNWKQRRLCPDRCPLVPPGGDGLKEPKCSTIKNHLGMLSGLYLDKERETQRRFNLSGHSEHVRCGARRQLLGQFSLRNQRVPSDHCLHVPSTFFVFPEC